MAGIDNNTVLYLRGDSFNDLSPNPKTVVNNGMVCNKDNLTFTGSSYFQITTGIDYSKPFTIELVANISSSVNSYGYYPCIFGAGNANPRVYNNFEFYFKPGKTICLQIPDTNSTEKYINYVINDIFDNKRHYCVSFDGYTYRVFIDGTLIGSMNISSSYAVDNSIPLRIGKIRDNPYYLKGTLYNVLITDKCVYTENFTPNLKVLSSIYIDAINISTDQINFNVTKLGQETINKVDLLINNEVVQTYNEIGGLTYNIDESIMNYGNNNIKIRVTFDNEYTEEAQATYLKEVELEEFEPVINLPYTANMQDIVNRISLINSTNKAIKNNLKTLLETKGFIVGDAPRLSSMVKLVNELSNNNSTEITEYINRITALESENENKKIALYNALVEKNLPCTQEDSFETLLSYISDLKTYVPKLYLYNEGDQCTDITGGFSDVFQYNYSSTNNTVVQYNADHIYLKATGVNSADSFRTVYTVKSLNLQSYTKLFVEYEIISVSNVGAFGGVGLDTNRSYIQSGTSNIEVHKGIGITTLDKGRLTRSMDITSGGTLVYPYINITTNGYSAYYIELKVYKLWVE